MRCSTMIRGLGNGQPLRWWHVNRIYQPNPKHKVGARGGGPPRWFPDSASKCPEDITESMAQVLLESSLEAVDEVHPGSRARFAVHEGRVYKAYPQLLSETEERWHGYPLADHQVRTQVPSRILRQLLDLQRISRAEYTRYLRGG